MIDRLLRAVQAAATEQLKVETGNDAAVLAQQATGQTSRTVQLHTFDQGQPVTVTVTVEVTR